MASYNELNALIDAYINRNGVQAITGQILNGVLKAMVEQLGRGYTIMGAAIPTTDPGTPDGPECYFASETGTYTDFDGLQVAPGELALLCYTPSDGWTKAMIYEGFQEVGATIDGNVGTPSVGVSYAGGVLSFDFRNMKGNPGDPAGFGTVNATVDDQIGTPSVSVQSSGPDTAKNFTFAFHNLKGETGVTSVVATVDNTSGTPSCAVSLLGQQLTLAFTGLKGAQGNTGVSADYPIAIINNLTTDDPASALSAAQGVVLDDKVSQLEAKVDELEEGELIIDTETHDYQEFSVSGYVVPRNANGNITPATGYHSTPFTNGQAIAIPTGIARIKAYCFANNAYYCGLAFYSSSTPSMSTFVAEWPRVSGISSGSNGLITIEASDIPEGATHIIATGVDTGLNSCYVKFETETRQGGLVELESEVAELNGNVSEIDGRVTYLENNSTQVAQDFGNSETKVISQKKITDVIQGVTTESLETHDYQEFSADGYVVPRNANGNITPASGWHSTPVTSGQAIAIPDGVSKIKAFCYANNAYYCGIVFYNSSTPAMASFVAEWPRVSGITNNGLVTINAEDIPVGATHIVVTGIDSDLSSCYVEFVTEERQEGLADIAEKSAGVTDGIVKQHHAIVGKSASIAQDGTLQITIPHTFKKYSIGCSMNVGANWSGRFRIKSDAPYNIAWIEVDNTNIYVYYSTNPQANPIKTIAHGLTISNFVGITIRQTSIAKSSVEILLYTQGGQYVNTESDNSWFLGGNKPLVLTMVSGGCTNAELSFSIMDCDVWLYGDSYLSYLATNISWGVSSHLVNLLFDGYPGRASVAAQTSFERSLAIGSPKVLVWALGMNNPDTSSAVNGDWKAVYDAVSEICDKAGIEFVPVTIPTTPNVQNNFKNAIIRASGRRYIDIAKAVGADGTGAWTTGLLSEDNVHPTSDGAKVIIGAYLSALPECFAK